MPRECGSCTKCCEGWLRGEVRGIEFHEGKACHFLDKKKHRCKIYEDRPEVPCRSFSCEWLRNPEFPDELYPLSCDVITSYKYREGITYIEAKEAGKPIDASTLNSLLKYCIQKDLNVVYQVNDVWHYIGSNKFVTLMRNT